MPASARPAARRFSCERLARSLRLGCSPAIPAVGEPYPGQHLTHYPVHLRPGDPGHLFPPIPAANSAGKPHPASTERCGDSSQPKCAFHTRPFPRRSFRSRIQFQCATATRPRKPASPRACPPERWTGSGGTRSRPGSGGTAQITSPGFRFRVTRTRWALM